MCYKKYILLASLRKRIITLFTLYLAILLLASPSCKKSGTDENTCGSYGGVVPPNTYLFWISKDHSCGHITVEVRDSDGRIVTPYQEKISYTSIAPPECNNTNYGRYATFDLYMGKTYTYKAACSGKTWNGTIQVPCEQNQCKNILLQ